MPPVNSPYPYAFWMVDPAVAPAAASAQLTVRRLDPAREVPVELLWRDEAPAPALRQFIRAAEAGAEPARSGIRPALVAVACART